MTFRTFCVSLWFASFGLVACGESQSPGEHTTGSAEANRESRDHERRRQAAAGARDHWIATGTNSKLEVVSKDGEPANVAGRFVNGGAGTSFGSLGKKGWLLASTDGWLQLVDPKGAPIGERRQAFTGSGTVVSLHEGNDNWLITSADGDVQLVDRNGQPTGTIEQPFGTTTVTAAAFGDSQWLVGTEDGQFVRLGASQLRKQSQVQSLSSSKKIVSIVRTSGSWFAFTPTEYAPVTVGGPGQLQTLATNRTITSVDYAGGTVAVGADDGRVLVGDPSNLGDASWKNALEGSAVRQMAWNGSEWLAVGDDGRVRRLDGAGNLQGAVETLGDGHKLGAVRSLSDGWMVGIAEYSAVQKVDGQLNAATNDSNVLEGAVVHDVVAGAEALLAVGDAGTYRLLNPDGSPKGNVQSIGGGETLRDAGWNGSNFIAVGDGGRVVLIGTDGSVVESVERLGGGSIPAVSWSGSYWLAVGADGTYQRLRANGAPYRDSGTVELDAVEFAEFNGDQWMVVGAKGAKGAFAIVSEDGSIHQTTKQINAVDGTLRTADWNGREWLVGGDGGIVARIGQGGSLITGGESKGIRDVLYGNPVRSIEFNARIYLVGGDHGAVRKLQFDTIPIRPAVALNSFETVHALEWANPRGFPGGPCLSSDFCLSGSCVGGVSPSGFCCESNCEGPCESCFSSVTGEPDGQCAPVPKGESPPDRKETGCGESKKTDCGRNGKCDGKGQCAYWGSDVQCAKASCEEGVKKSASHCNGSGTCVVDQKTDCAPVTVCTDSGATCATSCENSGQCKGELVCLEGECVDPSEQMQQDAGMQDATSASGSGSSGSGGGSGGGGGCTTSPASGPTSWWWVAFALVAVWRLRRRGVTGAIGGM